MRSATASAVGRDEVVDDPTVGEEQHAVGPGGGQRVVRDHDDRQAVVVDRTRASGRGSRRRCASRGRRSARPRTGRRAASPAPGRWRPAAADRPTARPVGGASVRRARPARRPRPTSSRSTRVPASRAGRADVLGHVEGGHQVVGLEDEPDRGRGAAASGPSPTCRRDRCPPIWTSPLVGRSRPGGHVQQRALAGAGRPHDGGEGAGGEGGGHVAQGVHALCPAAVGLRDVDDLGHRVSARVSRVGFGESGRSWEVPFGWCGPRSVPLSHHRRRAVPRVGRGRIRTVLRPSPCEPSASVARPIGRARPGVRSRHECRRAAPAPVRRSTPSSPRRPGAWMWLVGARARTSRSTRSGTRQAARDTSWRSARPCRSRYAAWPHGLVFARHGRLLRAAPCCSTPRRPGSGVAFAAYTVLVGTARRVGAAVVVVGYALIVLAYLVLPDTTLSTFFFDAITFAMVIALAELVRTRRAYAEIYAERAAQLERERVTLAPAGGRRGAAADRPRAARRGRALDQPRSPCSPASGWTGCARTRTPPSGRWARSRRAAGGALAEMRRMLGHPAARTTRASAQPGAARRDWRTCPACSCEASDAAGRTTARRRRASGRRRSRRRRPVRLPHRPGGPDQRRQARPGRPPEVAVQWQPDGLGLEVTRRRPRPALLGPADGQTRRARPARHARAGGAVRRRRSRPARDPTAASASTPTCRSTLPRRATRAGRAPYRCRRHDPRRRGRRRGRCSAAGSRRWSTSPTT